MIKYSEFKATNYYTEGFITSEPAPMVLMVESGKFIIKLSEENIKINEYPSFKFEIEPDEEFSVAYDVYLLQEENENGTNIHVDRTEIGAETICVYTGKTPMVHCLISFVVPPSATSLEDVSIEVKKIDLEEE